MTDQTEPKKYATVSLYPESAKQLKEMAKEENRSIAMQLKTVIEFYKENIKS